MGCGDIEVLRERKKIVYSIKNTEYQSFRKELGIEY
jgi:hypothetical protein